MHVQLLGLKGTNAAAEFSGKQSCQGQCYTHVVLAGDLLRIT